LLSWRSSLRPDLKTEQKELKRHEEYSWWLNVPTVKIAEKLAYHINETKDPIRYGPVQILLEKAENVDHLLIALQGIFWLQEHRSMDMGPGIIGLLCRTGARLGVPQLLNQVLGTTWCRFWPTSNSMHSLFEYYAQEARRAAYNTPVGPRVVEEKPAEEAKEEEEEEEGAEEKIPKPKSLTGDTKEFEDAFNESVRVLTKHFKLNPSDRIILSMVQYHAHRGDWDAAEAVLKTYPLKKTNAVEFEEAKLFCMLKLGKAQEVIDYINSSDLTSRFKSLKVFMPIVFGAYIQLGDIDNAVNTLKQNAKVRVTHLATAFKDEARAELIKQAVEKYKAEASNFQITETAQKMLENLTAGVAPLFPIEEEHSEE